MIVVDQLKLLERQSRLTKALGKLNWLRPKLCPLKTLET